VGNCVKRPRISIWFASIGLNQSTDRENNDEMIVTVDISKGFAAWKQMSKDMAPEMGKVGVKMVWAGTDPDESKVFVLVDMEDPEQMQTFGQREDVAKARAEGGEDVASTTVISPIGEHYMPS